MLSSRLEGLKVLPKPKKSVGTTLCMSFFFDAGLACFQGPNWQLLIRTVDATFPDYACVVPRCVNKHVRFAAAEVVAACKPMASLILARDCNFTLRLDADTGGKLRVQVVTNSGEGSAALNCTGLKNDTLALRVNGVHFLSAIKTLADKKSGGIVQLCYADELTPVILTQVNNLQEKCVIMPLGL